MTNQSCESETEQVEKLMEAAGQGNGEAIEALAEMEDQ